MLGVSLAYKRVITGEYPKPEPGTNEVLIRVRASAICRADLSLYHGTSVFGKEATGTIIVGHEPAGLVEAVGPGVETIRPGDRVAVHLAVSCGHCGNCKAGFFQHCAEFKCLGFDVHGADTEFLVVPERNCLKIPDEMDYVVGALSTDAVGTLYSIQKRLGVSGTDTIAIYGVGPMGAAGILVAKGLGAKVYAVDISDSRLEWAKKLGADEVINPRQVDPPEALRNLTQGRGVSVAIECSGKAVAENQAINSVHPHGRVGIVGACTEATFNPRQQFIRKQLTLIGNWYFNVGLYEEIKRFILQNNIPVNRLVTHRYRLADAEEAFVAFDEGRTGKVVFVND